ncbi:4-hydroxyphenylpyruvate dioxygenase [Oleiagrimonas citrea]|uniref:4-hydroxyphenylpyruvate dioxygenase n=1 Tax=Oleiagrimonas citrea TaxID=1665687 RepID=A0A846ZD62_9GAMM|nr:4-hydroxyphenylpyruvate dioxygenase [Oleiagrimonas citrea]NKZ37384.1 4-hydroxyphenylpyruvate dioxygenase [Oleiagrimonas citrea]
MAGLRDVEYVELWVEDAFSVANLYQEAFGFRRAAEAGPETGLDGHHSVVLTQGDAHMVVTSATGSEGAVADFVALHGDGVRDIAFTVDDAQAIHDRAVARGAASIMEPSRPASSSASVVRATISGFDDVVHTLFQSDAGFLDSLPDCYRAVTSSGESGPLMFDALDHVAMCLRTGTLDEVAEYYKRVLDFEDGHREVVYSERSGMNARVVQCGPIKFPLQEPLATNQTGPIAEFLELYRGAGVYHLAFLTDDIVHTLRELQQNRVEVMPTPGKYYDMLPDRVGAIDENVDDLRDLSVLVDRDQWGYLLQVFTRSMHERQTLFFEVIQRKNARGFGSGNIRALFDAVENDRLAMAGSD